MLNASPCKQGQEDAACIILQPQPSPWEISHPRSTSLNFLRSRLSVYPPTTSLGLAKWFVYPRPQNTVDLLKRNPAARTGKESQVILQKSPDYGAVSRLTSAEQIRAPCPPASFTSRSQTPAVRLSSGLNMGEKDYFQQSNSNLKRLSQHYVDTQSYTSQRARLSLFTDQNLEDTSLRPYSNQPRPADVPHGAGRQGHSRSQSWLDSRMQTWLLAQLCSGLRVLPTRLFGL